MKLCLLDAGDWLRLWVRHRHTIALIETRVIHTHLRDCRGFGQPRSPLLTEGARLFLDYGKDFSFCRHTRSFPAIRQQSPTSPPGFPRVVVKGLAGSLDAGASQLLLSLRSYV